MRKTSIVLACILCAALGFLGGAFATTRYWVRPNEVFNRVLAESFSTYVDLTELRKSNIDNLIEAKELQLDGNILALGTFANDSGKNGQNARKFLRKISSYRSKTPHISKIPEVEPNIKEILQLADKRP